MIGGVTERLAPTVANATDATEAVDPAAARVKIACSLTLLTGIFQVPVKPSRGRQRGLHALCQVFCCKQDNKVILSRLKVGRHVASPAPCRLASAP